MTLCKCVLTNYSDTIGDSNAFQRTTAGKPPASAAPLQHLRLGTALVLAQHRSGRLPAAALLNLFDNEVTEQTYCPSLCNASCAAAWSCAAAFRYHATAAAFLLVTPVPASYIVPSIYCALASPFLAALRKYPMAFS